MSQDNTGIRVLVAPLDWGLGHATRCIPVIREFIEAGCDVIIGTSGKSGVFLKNYFPELQYVDMPFVKIRFGTGHAFPWYIFQLLKFPFITIREHLFLKKHAVRLRPDLIISDNRYGLFHKEIYSVLITHQIFIILPSPLRFMQKIVRKITFMLISRFDQCLIPDLADPPGSLGNRLSHGKISLNNQRYIGFLSRFSSAVTVKSPNDNKHYDLLVILSGPEPQRTIFENIIINQTKGHKLKTVIFRGLPAGESEIKVQGDMTIINHPGDKDFISFIRQSENIICRSGYSTIMDLIALRRNALLVPTPGQTEQIYLARHLSSKGSFLYLPQKDFNITKALSLFERHLSYDYQEYRPDDFDLKETLQHLMNKISRQKKPRQIQE
jgi:uncharacterized protein (TIGR00661 family)